MRRPFLLALAATGFAAALYGAASLTGLWLGTPPWWEHRVHAPRDEFDGAMPRGFYHSPTSWLEPLPEREAISRGVVVAGIALAVIALWRRGARADPLGASTGEWEEEPCPPEERSPFFGDGSLRDVVVEDVDVDGWRRAVAYFASRGERLAFTLDGDRAPMPSDVAQILALRPESSPRLNFDVAGIGFACHFFDESEVELDLVPNDVDSQAKVAAVHDFIQGLANSLDREVLLTMEDIHDDVYWRIPPAETPGPPRLTAPEGTAP